MLEKSPSTTVPTLEAGDDTRNAILKFSSMLKRADKILNLQDTSDEPLPRVSKPISIAPPKATSDNHHQTGPTHRAIPYNDDEIDKPPPRVPPNDAQISTLFHPSSLPNNVRFHNSNDHQHNLHSKSNLIHYVYHNLNEDLIAQCISTLNIK